MFIRNNIYFKSTLPAIAEHTASGKKTYDIWLTNDQIRFGLLAKGQISTILSVFLQKSLITLLIHCERVNSINA